MPDNYYSEFNENGVVTPFRDLAAFPRSEQAVLGAKNLLPNNATSTGIFTVNSDGSVTVNGTPSSAVSLTLVDNLKLKPNIPYKVSKGLTGTNPQLIVNAYNNGAYVKNLVTVLGTDDLMFTPDYDGYTDIRVVIYVDANAEITNKLVKPMIRLASDTDSTYAPFAMTNKELTEAVTLKDVTSDITRNTEQTAYSISSLFVYKIGRLVTVIGDISSLTENAVPTGRSFITVATGLPKALKNSNIFAMPIGNGNQTQVYVEGNSSDMKMRGGTTGQSYQFVFTYISAS